MHTCVCKHAFLNQTCVRNSLQMHNALLQLILTCTVSDGQFKRQYTKCSSSLSSCHGSTTAMLCWWAYQPTCTTVCSQCSTLPHDPSPVYDAPTTSPTHSPVSTGWRSQSVFSLSWRQSSIVHWAVRLLATWLQICAVCLICRPDGVWDRHSLTSSMSASSMFYCLRPSFRCGWCSTMGQSTTWHRRDSRVTHCHSSVVDSKNFIQTVISFYFVSVLFLVVLAVFTARCTLVQSAVLQSHVVCLSVCLSVCNVGELWSHRLEFFENNFIIS